MVCVDLSRWPNVKQEEKVAEKRETSNTLGHSGSRIAGIWRRDRKKRMKKNSTIKITRKYSLSLCVLFLVWEKTFGCVKTGKPPFLSLSLSTSIWPSFKSTLLFYWWIIRNCNFNIDRGHAHPSISCFTLLAWMVGTYDFKIFKYKKTSKVNWKIQFQIFSLLFFSVPVSLLSANFTWTWLMQLIKTFYWFTC